MRSSTHRCLLAAAIAVALVGAEAAPPQDAPPAVTAADLAIRLATSGFSGGFVVPLPPHLAEALSRETGQAVTDRSAFGFWFSRAASAEETSRPASPATEIDSALRSYASSAAAVTPQTPASPNHRTLKDPAAAVCLARLQRVVPTPVQGTHLLRVLATAAGTATGAAVPRGFVGSCVGTNQFAEQPVHIDAGNTLEAALNQAVAGFGSAVWVAVQRGSTSCALGVVHRAEGGGVCTVTLAENLAAGGK
jgi:hypothetical protein